MPNFALSIHHLKKTYKANNVIAVDDLTLDIPEGEMHCLVGPDGAGKSSLFRIISTLILPDEGEVKVFGLDVVKDYKAIRKITGYMPGRFSLYMDLTILENLEFFATVFNTSIEENYDLIKDIYVQIEPFKNRRASQLSGGMKQKLALCCTLIHRPKILLLDEPTTGVDPISRNEFWEILKKLKSEGMTIVVSTPYMDEAAKGDTLSFIQNGKIIETDSPDNLLKNVGKVIFAAKGQKMHEVLLFLKNCPLVDYCYTFGDTHHLILKNNDLSVLQKLQSEGISQLGFPIEIKEVQANLEDCFILTMLPKTV